MRLLRTFTLISITLFIVSSCSLFDSDTLNNKYSDENITIEIISGTSQKPGNIEVASSTTDTIRICSENINECSFAYFSIEGMLYSDELGKWVKGEISISCDLYIPPLILLPMETKTIEIMPVLPKNEYTVHMMYYAVDNSPDFEPYTEVELGFRIKD